MSEISFFSIESVAGNFIDIGLIKCNKETNSVFSFAIFKHYAVKM